MQARACASPNLGGFGTIQDRMNVNCEYIHGR